jgi:hypothetical protein
VDRTRSGGRGARGGRLALAAALVWCAAGTVLPVAAGTVTTCGAGGTVEQAGNGWLASHPAFAAGPAEVTMVASPPYDPNLVYASNGTVLLRSVDAGCGWKEVYRAEPWVPAGTAAITSLDVPSSANSSSYVYVGVTTTLAGVTQPAIAASDNRGEAWHLADGDTGLPRTGRVVQVAASPQVPLVAFAVVETAVSNVAARAELYSTTDAGHLWTARTAMPESFTPRQLVVDPVRQSAVYAVDGGAPVRSLDNGSSFAPTPGSPGGPLDVLAAAPGAGGIRLVGGRADGVATRSTDGGRTWQPLKSPVPARAVAVGPLQDVVAVSDGEELWLVNPGAPPIGATPADGGAPVDLSVSAPTGVGFAVTGISSGAVFRVNFTTRGDPVPPVAGHPVLLLPLHPVGQFPSLLLPERLSVRLDAGRSMEVPYRLLVPRTPMSVDLMFLIDMTDSYETFIDSLRQGLGQIVNALNAGGLDGRFGVAGFRDYPPPYGIGSAGDEAYSLRRRIGPSDDALRKALDSLKTGGGTPDGGQSSLTAIYQAMTGAGERIRGKTVIKPGLDARFRPDSLKLALVSTDTAPHYRGQRLQGGVVQPGPSYAQTIKSLRAKGVRSIGIPVFFEGGPDSVPALTRLAKATNAYVPLGGVDCDGNGTVDLPTGSPMVCVIGKDYGGGSGSGVTPPDAASGLAAGIVGLVAGISDRKPVTLRITQGAERARIVSSPVRVVDLHADNELDFTVRLSCPLGPARHYDVGLDSATPYQGLAGGAISLACGGLPTGHARGTLSEEELADQASVDPPRGVAAHGLAQPNVNPQLNSQPNPQPNPHVNINPAPHVNTGVAAQEEQQLQIALAAGDVDAVQRGVPEMAMSDRRRADAPGMAFGLATAALLSGAAACAVRTRHRTALRVVRAR